MPRFLLIFVAALFILVAKSTAQESNSNGLGQGSMPLPADSFANAVGVCTHFSYPGTAYIVEFAKVSAALIKSGIRHIRDGGSEDPGFIQRIRYLGQHGVLYTTGWRVDVTPQTIRTDFDEFKPYIDAVEPANEYDEAARRDPDWQEHLLQEQKTLYDVVHNSHEYAGVTILGPSMAHTQLSSLPDFDAYEDAGNLHDYLCRRDPSPARIAQTLEQSRVGTSVKPVWTTETGDGDNPARNCWLPDDIIAKYDTRGVAERLIAGEPRVFFYQFADTADPGFGAYGLIKADGQPKPQYTALASLISLLADRGPSYALKPLEYDIASPSPDVGHLLLQKRTGVYELLLWQEVRSYRDTSSGGVAIPIAPVNVEVSTSAHALKYYTFDSNWNLQGGGLNGPITGKITVPVTDSISVLELR